MRPDRVRFMGKVLLLIMMIPGWRRPRLAHVVLSRTKSRMLSVTMMRFSRAANSSNSASVLPRRSRRAALATASHPERVNSSAMDGDSISSRSSTFSCRGEHDVDQRVLAYGPLLGPHRSSVRRSLRGSSCSRRRQCADAGQIPRCFQRQPRAVHLQ